MSTILDRIVASKRQEIAQLLERTSTLELRERARVAPAPRDFLAALRDAPGVRVIAEVKKASPSAGAIRTAADVETVARNYQQHGASCISVLTDTPFFQGSLADLVRVRQSVAIPVLRKDFILDQAQVLEARAAGADAVLLIAEILDDQQLRALRQDIEEMGMTALVECHDADNLPRVIASGARLIGINNRDLRTFTTTLEHTVRLASQIPTNCCVVSESGIRTRADVERLRASGVKAILVGETLMRAEDLGGKLRELASVG